MSAVQGRSITGSPGTSKSWSAPPTIPGMELSGLTTGRSVPGLMQRSKQAAMRVDVHAHYCASDYLYLLAAGTGKTPMGGPIVLTMPRPAATALPRRSVPGMLGQRAENSSCRSLGTSEQAGKPIAIVEGAHAKLPVKCAAKPPFVSKTALHGDLLET